jgi:hypothetical protein
MALHNPAHRCQLVPKSSVFNPTPPTLNFEQQVATIRVKSHGLKNMWLSQPLFNLIFP